MNSWMIMITAATLYSVAWLSGSPSLCRQYVTRLRTMYVLSPIQARVMTPLMSDGRWLPLRPNAIRPRANCETPVRLPISVNTPKISAPAACPIAMITIDWTRLRPSCGPIAPTTHAVGAMLAPNQIQNCCQAVESRSESGIGSIPC